MQAIIEAFKARGLGLRKAGPACYQIVRKGQHKPVSAGLYTEQGLVYWLAHTSH